MLPASTVAPPPAGYQRIECRHAHEVDTWSNRLRAQEKRFFEMTDLERFEYEGKIQSHIIEEMEACLASRASRRPPKAPENHMACESSEGVAS